MTAPMTINAMSISKRVEEGKAINRADLLRMALRAYIETEKEKEMERMRLRQGLD